MRRDYRNPAADARWRAMAEDPQQVPFAFTYDGREYKGFSPECFTLKDTKTDVQGEKESRTYVWDFSDGLEVTLLLTHYFSHGATEWTVWFENTGTADTKILEDLHTELEFAGAYPVVKGILGDHTNQYRPYAMEVTDNRVEFSSDSGRATHINFPYFNLEHGDGGTLLAIGWAGTWNAVFAAEGNTATGRFGAVNGMHLYLKPGEKIRSALFVMMPYTVRSEACATNHWRSWFIEHNLPKADSAGAAMEPFSTAWLAGDTGLPNSDGSISERYFTWRPTMEKMLAEDIYVDFRWFDAGWYARPDGGSEETDWWGTVGTWELDPEKWPGRTFAESVDFAHEHGTKTLVWFEPERVTDPDNLAKNFGYNTDWAIRVEGERTISNNIGVPECLEWTTNRICKMLRENKVDMYREDNNCNPAPLWKHLDAQDGRQGITECKFIGGHYKMWDDIIACTLSYGGCGFVDSCASGGGRNDLESLRRGVPLLRSDSDRTSIALRLSMTTAFNKWIPFCGAHTREKLEELALEGVMDPYTWRASYLPALNLDSQFVYAPDQDFSMLRFGLQEWNKVKPYLLKEFYPLTPWHAEKDTTDFTAYCFYDPETEEGALLAFRQEKCVRDTLRLALPFAKNGCTLTDEDTGETIACSGTVELHFDTPRTARLLWVRGVK
ncbi:MAG: alpha-galactosidase [Clostridia bacterium]|nr:alpha-galactosidase [Clostridia bacterium]